MPKRALLNVTRNNFKALSLMCRSVYLIQEPTQQGPSSIGLIMYDESITYR